MVAPSDTDPEKFPQFIMHKRGYTRYLNHVYICTNCNVKYDSVNSSVESETCPVCYYPIINQPEIPPNGRCALRLTHFQKKALKENLELARKERSTRAERNKLGFTGTHLSPTMLKIHDDK